MKQSKLVCALGLGLATLIASTAGMAQDGPNPNRVWVKFKSGGSAANARGLAAAPNLGQRIQALRSKLSAAQAGDAQLNYQFDRINAAVMTLASPEAVKALRANPEVESVEIDQPRYLQAQSVPYGIDQVQARDVWDANRDGVLDTGAANGSGIKVCIIDSGLNKNHEDFAGMTITGYPTGWDTDTCGHGTHVAGTIAAVNNDKGVVGVSPGKVSLHIVKIFGSNGYNGSGHGQCSWTYSSTLADAAQRCQAAGAKIINMSLGGPNASTAERTAFQNVANAGVLSIAAAGNDGNNTQSYPAGYTSVVSVAAVDSANVKASFSQFTPKVELSAPGVDVLSTFPLKNDPLVVGSSSFAATPVGGSKQASASAGWVNGGLCQTSATSWRNKIVVCQRGTNTFYEKVSKAQSGRAAGVVIYNNVDGAFAPALYTGTAPNLTAATSSLPAVAISKADGEYLVANLAGQTASVDATPSVTNNAYETMSGTSMATPHVSGSAAVVWSAKPAATAQQVRDALDATAKDIDAAGRDDNTGWGLVQIPAAIAELQSQ
ncbi:S8 family serine peptidase [Lysobacter enzymogenes]|uniref:S8 family serine peptidase n=1 Tax=Lysobacter enzymogenes TaxID=69 RepID=UPI001A97B836|nr:S8 family serine peptidase [Lysobacter enzymogenes]QQP97231.1 S8 family serine peptidase [Lysobacter enzymogenes]